MADEKPKTTDEPAPKPVRRVKKVLPDAPVDPPASEVPSKPAPKPAAKPAAKAPIAKTPAKAPGKKPAPKAAPKPKPTKAPEPKPAPKPVVAEKEEPEKVPEKKAPKKPEKAPAKEKKPAKKEKKPSKKPAKEDEEAEEAEEEEEHEARKKPQLTDAIRAALRIRREVARRRPTFYRQEWFRYQRLGLTWRKPQGGQSKLRRHYGYRINVVSIGYRGPRPSRGLHPSGFQEVLVYNPAQLKGIDPKTQAARIAHGVGGRKRDLIHEAADELGIRILNRREE